MKKKYRKSTPKDLRSILGRCCLAEICFVLNVLTDIDTDIFLIIFVCVFDFAFDFTWGLETVYHLFLASGGRICSADLFWCDAN